MSIATAVPGGGTGEKLTRAVVILSGVASLVASLVSFLSIWLQLKNYRKPLLQRYVVRILLMVPIYSASSWTSLMSLKAAFWVDPIRDIYEAFTIYTFLQLLINFIGGERALIIMMHGRRPVHHVWPLNQCLPKVDISDPHTFLAIKRGILQYAWLKPILTVATLIMKATDTYQEGYIGLSSGYLWSGIIYNLSVTISLYSLGLFWVCMSEDLQPFRPVPKFLCIKLIIFASYWQGFFLSILVFLGAIPDDVTGYSPDNLAAAIQDALICCEMPIFAVAHWYAFSWHDYADDTISAARMPVKYALRDAFGIRDLIEDTKETFVGDSYEYRIFDSGDHLLSHEDTRSRTARMMEGMRYERGGKAKYWIPKPGEPTSRTPLLSSASSSRARTMSPTKKSSTDRGYSGRTDDVEPIEINDDDENLFRKARALKFGDWNYPVITAYEASRERWMNNDPNIITTSTNRHLLQPTADGRRRRESAIKKTVDKGKSPNRESHGKSRAPLLQQASADSSSSSSRSGKSQLVDLIVEDHAAEETARVRARKEGGSNWNEQDGGLGQRVFVRTYGEDEVGEEMRTGYEPETSPVDDDMETHGDGDTGIASELPSGQRDGGGDDQRQDGHVSYGSLNEERDVWSS